MYSYVLDPETCGVAGTWRQEERGRWYAVCSSGQGLAVYGGLSHDVGQHHSLTIIFTVGTVMRSLDASLSWC